MNKQKQIMCQKSKNKKMNKQINRERRDKIETNRITQKQNNTKAEHVREKESDRERRSTVVRVVVSRLEDGGGLDQCFHLQSTPSFFLSQLALSVFCFV
jgi:hypothetical protein